MIIEKVRKDLSANADIKTREGSIRFFREKINPYGVRSAIVTAIGKQYWKELKDKPREYIFELCEELWRSGYLEETFIACNWSYNVHRKYEPGDFSVFERWVERYVNNWASCDTLCNHTVGEFIQMYPAYIKELKRWATSDNRWQKRASAVSLIIPARKGKFLDDIFEIADIMLHDKDDMVQKGYGWMLKEASKAHQMEVFDYVMKKKAVMPRTALRYAIEKMPTELRTRAMAR